MSVSARCKCPENTLHQNAITSTRPHLKKIYCDWVVVESSRHSWWVGLESGLFCQNKSYVFRCLPYDQWVRADVSLIKPLIWNMEWLLKCGNVQAKRQLVLYYLLHQLLLNWCVCWSMCCVVGCGGELKPGRMCVSGQSLQGRAPKLHTHSKSQSPRKAIGLTAHVIETAKPRRPRALTRVAVVESGGGLAG